MNTSNETRSANGDLNFERSEDKIVQARNNLRYWHDRNAQSFGKFTSQLANAAQYAIDTIDEHYQQS